MLMKEYDRRETGGGHFHSKVIGMLVVSSRVLNPDFGIF